MVLIFEIGTVAATIFRFFGKELPNHAHRSPNFYANRETSKKSILSKPTTEILFAILFGLFLGIFEARGSLW